MEDRATLRSDLSAMLGLQEGDTHVPLSFILAPQCAALLGIEALNLGGSGAEPCYVSLCLP